MTSETDAEVVARRFHESRARRHETGLREKAMGNPVKEFPILFSAPMILAIQAGRKSVTRRLDKRWLRVKAGDVLWVRETWRPEVAHSHGMNACDCADVNITYAADGQCRYFEESQTNPEWVMPKAASTGNVTPLFMPRWASRIILDVTEDARMERLAEITEEESIAEGVRGMGDESNSTGCWIGRETRDDRGHLVTPWETPREAFADIWSGLHDKPSERWEDNPQIVRLAFTVEVA